jgi:hypothetical protein
MFRKCIALASFSTLALWANNAFALCIFGFGDCGSGGGGAVPEISGGGAIVALALLVAIVAIFYHRHSTR